MRQTQLNCPRCHKLVTVSLEEIDHDDERAEHIPEGLDGYSMAQCQECHHEWEVVTRSQILRSLRLWNTAPSSKVN